MPQPLGWTRRRLPMVWLVVIAVASVAVQVWLVPLDTFLSWDEAIYAGQFAHGVPHTVPSPHRAPGMAYLLAPVTVFTTSFTAARIYLTVLLAVGLVLAYWCWIPVDSRAAPLAALLFAATKETMLLGHLALPNLPVALVAVAAVALFVRTGHPDRPVRVLVGLALTLGALAVLRPTDAVFLATAMGVAVVLVRRWRRLDLVLAVAGGLAIGFLVWLVEAYDRFGGPARRLADTRSIARAEGEPLAVAWSKVLLDRAAESPGTAVAVGLGAVAAVVLLCLAVRAVCGGRPAAEWLLTLFAAASLAVPYYLLLAFTADRYLMPATALLAVVVAAALVRLVTAWPGVRRVLTTAAVTVLVLLYVGFQVRGAHESATYLVAVRQARAGYAEVIGEHGIRPPCLVSGYQAPAFAYTLGCRSGDNLTALPSTTNWHREFERDWRTAQRDDVRFVAVFISEEPPAEVADWERVKLAEHAPIYAYFAPSND